MLKLSTSFQPTFKISDSLVCQGSSCPCITGQVGEVDVVSPNGYRYKTDFWDKVLQDSLVQSQIDSRDVLGTIEHPTDDESYLRTPYEEASHVVIKAWTQNHQPFATFALLNNPKGNAIKALLDIGHKPGVSTRGMGNFTTDSISQFVESDGYIFITWDIVRNPNFCNLKMDAISDSLSSHPLFKELCDMHHVKDNLSDTSYNIQSLKRDMNSVVQQLSQIQQKLLTI